VAPAAIEPSEQTIGDAAVHDPWDADAKTSVERAGIRSVRTTFAASSAERLRTVNV
jgi:hypothetical protein